MIDIDIYRSRIGCFIQKVGIKKCLFKNYYFDQAWVNKNTAGNTAFMVLQSLMKIIFLILLLGDYWGVALPDTGQGGYRQRVVHHGGVYVDLQGHGVVHTAEEVQTITELVCFFRLGKKATSNFLSRYLHGNRKQGGVQNFHLNIRSLRYKVSEIKNIVREYSPQILGLSECELSSENIDVQTLKVPGYDLIFPKSWATHGFARVVTYVKKTYKYEHLLELEDDLVQFIWLRGNLNNSKKVYYCHAYREHHNTHPLEFQRDYLGRLLAQWEAATEHNFPTEPNEVHVSLDMNIDTYQGRWLQSDYRLVSLSRLVDNACNIGNFAQLVTEPTRTMYNSITGITDISCIDHVYTNAKYRCSKPTVISFGASDHDIISYTRFSKEPPVPTRTIRRRSYKDFVKEDFISDLSTVDWTEVLACIDLDQAVDIFTRKFRDVLNVHAPWVIFQKRRNFTPWLTTETKELMRQRDMWKQKAKELAIIAPSNTSEEQREAWDKFKYFRNKVNNKRKFDEKEYKREKFEQVKNSPTNSWKCAKNFMNWKCPGSPSQIVVDNILVTKARDIAEHMNNFFIDKVNRIRSCMRNVPWDLQACTVIMEGKNCKLGLSHVSVKKVEKLIRSLSCSTSLA